MIRVNSINIDHNNTSLICAMVCFSVMLFQAGIAQGIASQFPGDKNIHQSPHVIFTEMAEETSLVELFSKWSSNSTSNSVALDSTTSPNNSPGKQSIRLFTTAGIPSNPGTHQTAMLYKLLSSGINDSLFLRWYVKYNSNRTFHHSGTRIGGSYPPSIKPNAPAGVLPNDSTQQFFYSGAEVTGARTKGASFSTFDFYNYWLNQRHSSFFPDSAYYGNSFINSKTVGIDMNTWNCIEMRLKLNAPADSSGEISLWINGSLVSQVGTGTTGSWTDDDFFPGVGPAFEGFRWRKNANLNINYIWLLHYVDKDSVGQINSVNYDHIVAAKSYIGPITSVTNVHRQSVIPSSFSLMQNYPNPFNPVTTISFTLHEQGLTTLKIFDTMGREVKILVNERKEAGTYSVQLNASALSSGTYFYQLRNNSNSSVKRMTYLR